MCTLSAVYQALLRQEQALPPNQRPDIKLCEPPTYIRTLASPHPPNRKLVLVYKQSDTAAAAIASPETDAIRLPPRKRGAPTYELTGTPLEDDCEIDTIDDSLLRQELDGRRLWAADEAALAPIPLDQARQLLNSVSALPCSDGGAVWTLCQSSAADEEPEQLALMVQYTEGWHTRGLVRYLGSVHYRDIDLVLLRQQHLAYIRPLTATAAPAATSAATGVALQTHVEAHFDILPTLSLRLAWDVAPTAATSALANYRKADICVTQTVRMGSAHAQSVADDLWRQLMRLDLIREQIVAYREREDRQLLVYQSGSELSMNAVRERVQRIVSDVAPLAALLDDGGAENAGVSNGRGAVELEPVIKRSYRRELPDITDQLWMLLKLCASYEDLKAAFNYIFQCAAKCNVVNTPTGSNHFAVLIREISEQRLAIPCLSGAEPLELLLEIGLEKAARDYEHIFTEAKLCSAKEFHAAFSGQAARTAQPSEPTAVNSRQTMMLRNQRLTDDDDDDGEGGASGTNGGHRLQNSQFVRTTVEQRMARLAHAHLLMEHMLLVQIHLNWTDMHDYVVSDLRRPANKPFAAYRTLFSDTREIPIACSRVVSKVERIEPTVLRVRMSSATKFKRVENTFVYSTSPLLPPEAFPQLRMDEQTLESPAYSAVNFLRLATLR